MNGLDKLTTRELLEWMESDLESQKHGLTFFGNRKNTDVKHGEKVGKVTVTREEMLLTIVRRILALELLQNGHPASRQEL